MKQLNIFELRNNIQRKKNLRIEIFEKILLKAHAKILRASENEKFECTFDTPIYVAGLPLYNINNCIDFIINKLEENGFKVVYQFPKTLTISWYPPEQMKDTGNKTNDESLYLNYVPYKNTQGKFVLNVD